MTPLERRIQESVSCIRKQTLIEPRIAIILGSGLGEFADSLPNNHSISTSLIPHYPQSSVEGHKGKLVFASIGSKSLLAFQGRVHFYESNSVETVLYPLRVAHTLGVKTLVVTNAAGGINRSFSPGDLMLITDQVNLTNETVALDSNQGSKPNLLYSKVLGRKAFSVAGSLGIALKSGVYVGLKGPSYETAAEIEMIRRIGGDAVGMSTVLEVSYAAHMGMEILGISCITNLATGISSSKLNHAEVTEVGNRVKKTFARLVSSVIAAL
jgi:purine-nucleoside phosphorylase